MVASLLLPLLLLASSHLAVVSARPSSPLTSLNGNQALRSIQQRQAKSADVVRRMKSGSRRRAVPSTLPQTCPAASGYNALSDGDFQALGTSLACYSSSSTTSSGQGFVTQGNFAYQEDSDGANVNDHYSYMAYASAGPAIISVSQTAAVKPGMYDFYFRLGVARVNSVACPVTVTLNDPTHSLTIVDLCADSSQGCISSGNGVWTQLSIPGVVIQDSTTTVSISWDCRNVATYTSSFYYMADDLVLSETA